MNIKKYKIRVNADLFLVGDLGGYLGQYHSETNQTFQEDNLMSIISKG
jgi:hypothetical protein